MRFEEVKSELYVWKPSYNTNLTNNKIPNYSCLTLGETNKKDFTRYEVKRAEKFKDLYINLGMPGYRRFF